jgi:hypothetical protein
MAEKKRTLGEQRTDNDRRMVHDLEYFMMNDVERRAFRERRSEEERRADHLRTGKWVSFPASELGLKN